MLDANPSSVEDTAPSAPPAESEAAFRSIASDAGMVSLLVADVSGVLDQVCARTNREGSAIATLRHGAGELAQVNADVIAAARSAAETGEVERGRIDGGLAAVAQMVNGMTGLTRSAESMGDQVSQLNSALELVSRAAGEIGAIARMTSLLAVNATIEAARAGDTGRGFKIIAQEVKNLSERTSQTTEQIGKTLEQLNAQTSGVTDAAGAILKRIHELRHEGSEATQALSVISDAIETMIAGQERIRGAVEANSETILRMHEGIETLSEGAEQTRSVMKTAGDQVEQLFTASQNMMGACVSLDIETDDTPFIDSVQNAASQVAALFEAELASGRIQEAALFDMRYQPIPGTDPQQFMTPSLSLTDRVLPAVQEPVLALSDKVVFCAAVDVNGYLPTHNSAFSKRQRPGDTAWNTANCRNRRIFDDRTGLAAARNEAPFLLQVYRRDMGGGTFLLMKDVSAPIIVQGRHWGALRLAYKA